jgi:DNA-binding CsgD family transcriptional regulator
MLDELLVSVRSGRSGALVLRGDAGSGKTALLDYLEAGSDGCRVERAVGVESEMELPFATLHQLCFPLLDGLQQLPEPQGDALKTAFGLSGGRRPEPFFVGLAVLTLLSDAAEARPVVCIVDDAHWLDHSSAVVLAFVARRLEAESVLLVFAEREEHALGELAGLPNLNVGALSEADARALLMEGSPGPLDERVVERIIAETRGNPLALLELPRAGSAASFAGGFALPDALPIASQIEASFRHRVDQLPEETQRLLLVSAADPVGDPMLLWRAAGDLGIPVDAAAPAEEAGLLVLGPRVAFRHPLLRSAIYRGARPAERRAAHDALAAATDAESDPDRRAWHGAHATLAPNDEVADELERSAGRAQARGGLAAAAAFLKRAVALTQDPQRRAERALAAAQASLQAGAFDAALGLVTTAEAGALDEFQRARVDLLRGHIAFASGLGRDAPRQLLTAARRLEPFDLDLARETYLTAWGAAVFAGHLAEGNVLLEICRAARALPPPPGTPRPLDLLLDGFALLTTDGRAAATPTLQRAVRALADLPVEDILRWGWAATGASDAVWDDEGTRAILARQVQLVRNAGALSELPIHLSSLGLANAWMGDFAGAGALIAEADSVAAATGSPIGPYTALRLRALQGEEAEASGLIASAIEQAAAGGQGMAATMAHWAGAVLYNGLARYEDAAAAARNATSNTLEPWVSMWALPELVEAAARLGQAEIAKNALERLIETTEPAGTEFGLGIETRSRALLSEGETAEGLYREAIDRLGRTRLRPDLARAHLLYGEWLRRERRRVDAREQLRIAYELLDAIGMQAFAERARRELAATGLKVRKRVDETLRDLTPQEVQIARLAREGYTNPEIGTQLFLSPRTVEWHLHKVFAKLGISSRRELRVALAGAGRRN